MAQASSDPTQRLNKVAEDRVGEYRVLERVGSGGMATVWRVEGPGGAIHALKEMRPQQQAQREMTRRFKQEFEITAQLDHRNIVAVRDFFAAQNTMHIVMEWVDGPDLRDVLRYAGTLDAGRLALIGSEIAAGLSAAHAQGVLHRDLKPENILMTRRGQVKIADFGVARVMGTRLTATGIIVGSPAYMSPEQLSGVSGQKLSSASDSYSLGVMLYELGEARDPLGLKKHEDLLSVLRTKREKKPKAMRNIQHPELQELLLRCLEPDEDHRPGDMATLGRSLRSIARREGATRSDIEFLIRTALTNRTEKIRAKGAPAPRRPSSPARAAPRARRDAETVSAVSPEAQTAPAEREQDPPPVKKNRRTPSKRRPAEGPRSDTRGRSRPRVRDFGHSQRIASRVKELSVKRRAHRREERSLISWAALLLLGLSVIFLATSASLTGSPLGLLEMLVPLR